MIVYILVYILIYTILVYIYNGWHDYFYVKDITLSDQQVIIIQRSSMELLSVPYLGFTSHKFPIFMATIHYLTCMKLQLV